MRWYQLPGWPARVAGHAAAMPGLTRQDGGGQQYKDGVTGRPGTAAIPVPGPGVQAGRASQATGGYSSTAAAPPAIYPNQYWARPQRSYHPGAGQPISVFSDNLMPVPATDPRGVAAPMAVPLSLRGARQIRQPHNLIMWQGVNE